MTELELETLSVQATEHVRAADSPTTSRRAPRSCGLLVVDDEPCVRDVLNIAMQRQEFAVWLAADGREALDLYRRHREHIDVVLLDVRMPGLDGPQTLAALRELNPKVCCCFMSGDLGSHTQERLHGLGVERLLAKPFELAAVAQVVRELASSGDSRPPDHNGPAVSSAQKEEATRVAPAARRRAVSRETERFSLLQGDPMPATSKAPPAVTISEAQPYVGRFAPAPSTTEDRLLHIRRLGERIAAYVEFMGAVGNLQGSSLEAKENAVAAFHERLSVAERQLGRIQSDLQMA